MRIQTIDLTNWCQHKRVERDFGDANLIGLIGSNGSGKSNVLAAMQFAITGETSDKLEEYVRDGTDLATVIVRMRVGKANVTVKRTVKKDGKASAELTIEDGEETETLSGIKNVNEELESMLQIDRDLAKNNVFVEQKHLDDILFTTPAKRERAWQRMCGMADAEKIHRIIGDVVSSLPDQQDYAAQIFECNENVEAFEEAITKTQAKLESLREMDKYDLDKIQSTLSELEKCRDARANLPTAKVKYYEADGEVNGGEEELTKIKEELANLTEDENVLLQKENAVNELLNKLSAAKEAKKRVTDTEAELAVVQENLAALPTYDVDAIKKALDEVDEQVADLNARVLDINSKKGMNQSLVTALREAEENLAECPLCGSSIADKAAVLARVNSKVGELENERLKLDKERHELSSRVAGGRDEITNHVRTVDGYKSRLTMLERDLETAKKHLDTFDVSEYDEGHLREVVVNLNHERNRIVGLRSSLPQLEQRVVTSRKRREELKEAFENLTKEAGSQPEDMNVDQQIVEMKGMQAEVMKLREEIAADESLIVVKKDAIERWNKTKAELERKSGLGTAHSRVKESLERVRHWFHYSQGPHKLSMAVLNELTAGVNEFLGTLDGKFYVEPDPENLMFNIVFVDGRAQPETPRSASRASGGEKSSLATSFRLASYYMFAGSLGLLCLDEPTEYLDTRKVESFGRVIEQLKEIGSQLDLQIFMATHRQSFFALFDDVIQCGSGPEAA